MDEILKRDQNHVTVLAGVTDGVDKDIVMLRVDPITKKLLVKGNGDIPSGARIWEIPFVNATEDGFTTSDAFLFEGQEEQLQISSRNPNGIGAANFTIEDGFRVVEFHNSGLDAHAGYFVTDDFSTGTSGVDSFVGSFGSDRNGFAVKYDQSDEAAWGYVLYKQTDGFIYDPLYPVNFQDSLYFAGETYAQHVNGWASASPSMVLGTGAGTSPTSSIQGTDTGMRIVITTGTTPATNATVATLTFNRPYAIRPIVVISAGNAAAAARAATVHCDAPDGGTFTIKVAATALSASTAYAWNVHVIGQEII